MASYDASTYSVDGHALLSSEAQSVANDSPSDFSGLVTACFALLRLPIGLTDGRKDTARIALVRQVNYVIEKGAMSEVLKSKSQGDRSWSFREGIPVDVMAKELAEQLRRDSDENQYEIQNTLGR